MDMVGYVYVAVDTRWSNFFKIGKTSDPVARFFSLRTANPFLEYHSMFSPCIAMTPLELECRAHDHFSALGLRFRQTGFDSEWFGPLLFEEVQKYIVESLGANRVYP